MRHTKNGNNIIESVITEMIIAIWWKDLSDRRYMVHSMQYSTRLWIMKPLNVPSELYNYTEEEKNQDCRCSPNYTIGPITRYAG